MPDIDDLSDRLRALPVFAGALPAFHPSTAPPDPTSLFAEWIDGAIEANVREPHAMSLATLGDDGPNLRVLILKGVTPDGAWQFAGSNATTKGLELAARPAAAAAFYWPALGRQVRLRGPVREAGAAANARDFLARGAGARAETLVGRQGQELEDPAQIDAELAAANERVAAEPELVSDRWTLWEVVADEVEFFQGDANRKHGRLVYRREPDGWTSTRRWP